MNTVTRTIIALSATVLASIAYADEPLPNHVDIGVLGQIDPNTGLLRSFDSGNQRVPVPPLSPEWFYEFTFDSSLGAKLDYWIDNSSGCGATIELQDLSHNNLGPLAGSSLTKPGSYFIHVIAASLTQFHFAIIGEPQLTLYPNDAGHTQADALNLGTLTASIRHNNSFYTAFPRQIPPNLPCPTTISLTPDFNKPIPYPPSLDWYQFSLVIPGTVTLQDNGANPGPNYVLVHPDGTRGIWNNNISIALQPGTYSLIVADRLTMASGTIFIRNSRLENFEHYSFALNLSAGGQLGQPTAVDLTTTLFDVNTNLGIGHSTTTKPGRSVVVTFTVNNIGYPASSAGNVGIYLSQTPTLAPNAVFLAKVNIFTSIPANGSTPSITSKVQLPSLLDSGTYYIIVVADYDHGVPEINYDNNASAGTAIMVGDTN